MSISLTHLYLVLVREPSGPKDISYQKLENQDTGLKFCVAQRDFLVGKTIIDNIMDTISKSRKTILLVDETFMESEWCQEELLLSHHVSTYPIFECHY